MRRLATWLKRTLGLLGVLALVSSFSTAEGAATSTKSVSNKPTTKATTKSTSTTKAKSTHAKPKHKGKRSKRVRGQQKIDAERTHQIQEALIRQHYLSGEASGKWDAATEAALRRFQADNGWQNKTVPDSRALIKLGLGPNHDHLLNPESAMTSAPDTSTSTTTTPVADPAPNNGSGRPNQPQQ